MKNRTDMFARGKKRGGQQWTTWVRGRLACWLAGGNIACIAIVPLPFETYLEYVNICKGMYTRICENIARKIDKKSRPFRSVSQSVTVGRKLNVWSSGARITQMISSDQTRAWVQISPGHSGMEQKKCTSFMEGKLLHSFSDSFFDSDRWFHAWNECIEEFKELLIYENKIALMNANLNRRKKVGIADESVPIDCMNYLSTVILKVYFIFSSMLTFSRKFYYVSTVSTLVFLSNFDIMT